VARGEKTGDLGDRMRPTPESSTQEVLAGLVERVTFHNAENGFCVLRAKARGHLDLVTVESVPNSLIPTMIVKSRPIATPFRVQ